MTATITAPAALANYTRVASVWERKVRTVAGLEFDAETRDVRPVTRGEFYANAHIGYVGQAVDGTWDVLTVEGKPFIRRLNNATSAKLAARRHFGPVLVG